MRTKTFKGVSMPKAKLDAYGVGLMRINEANIAVSHFDREDIEYIGQCSMDRRKVEIGKVGNFWCVYGMTSKVELKMQAQYGRVAKFKKYYIINGRRVTVLHPCNKKSMADFECRGTSKPLDRMSAEEIFNAAKVGRSTKHGGKANSHADIGKYKSRSCMRLSVYGY